MFNQNYIPLIIIIVIFILYEIFTAIIGRKFFMTLFVFRYLFYILMIILVAYLCWEGSVKLAYFTAFLPILIPLFVAFIMYLIIIGLSYWLPKQIHCWVTKIFCKIIVFFMKRKNDIGKFFKTRKLKAQFNKNKKKIMKMLEENKDKFMNGHFKMENLTKLNDHEMEVMSKIENDQLGEYLYEN